MKMVTTGRPKYSIFFVLILMKLTLFAATLSRFLLFDDY